MGIGIIQTSFIAALVITHLRHIAQRIAHLKGIIETVVNIRDGFALAIFTLDEIALCIFHLRGALSQRIHDNGG